MLVHPHEAGNQRLAFPVDHFRARRHVHACRGTPRGNFALVDDDSLVRLCSRASAIISWTCVNAMTGEFSRINFDAGATC